MSAPHEIIGDPPLALFPGLLGCLGLALAWREMEPAGVVGAVLGLIFGAIFLGAFILAVFQRVKRPQRFWGELRRPSGRAASAAGAMGAMTLAWLLAPVDQALALAILIVGIAAHTLISALTAISLWRNWAEEPPFCPLMFLPFVGGIVAPAPLVALGFPGAASGLFFYSLATAAVVAPLTHWIYVQRRGDETAHPSAAISLAPCSVAAVAAAALGFETLFAIFAISAPVMAVILLIRVRWLIAGGFSPAWGAFTFPSAAFAGAMALAAARWGGAWELAAWGALAAASLIAPGVFARTAMVWLRGRLA